MTEGLDSEVAIPRNLTGMRSSDFSLVLGNFVRSIQSGSFEDDLGVRVSPQNKGAKLLVWAFGSCMCVRANGSCQLSSACKDRVCQVRLPDQRKPTYESNTHISAYMNATPYVHSMCRAFI